MMRRSFLGLCSAVALAVTTLVAAPDVATAQETGAVVTGSQQDRIVEILTQNGASVENEVVGGFDSLYVEDRGLIYQMLFLRCDPAPCRMVQLRTRFVDGALSSAQANEWNVSTSFARSIIDPDGTPELRMDIMMGSGLPEDVFMETIANWYALIPMYAQFISTGTNPFMVR